MTVKSYIFPAIIMLVSGCSSADRTTVPRPEGFPRISLPAREYISPDGIPLSFDINRDATVSDVDTAVNGAIWLTADYPEWNASIYVTFTPVENEAQAREVSRNRYERLTRDLGQNLSRISSKSEAGEFAVYTTGDNVPTPAAGLLVANDRFGYGWVLSATVTLNNEAFVSSPDSMAPVREYVIDDLIHGFRYSHP